MQSEGTLHKIEDDLKDLSWMEYVDEVQDYLDKWLEFYRIVGE